MIQKIKTLLELNNFLNSLTKDQLEQPIRACKEEESTCNIFAAEILECDWINPSGEGSEPINGYLEGGEFFDKDFDISDEPIVAKKGDIYFYAD